MHRSLEGNTVHGFVKFGAPFEMFDCRGAPYIPRSRSLMKAEKQTALPLRSTLPVYHPFPHRHGSAALTFANLTPLPLHYEQEDYTPILVQRHRTRSGGRQESADYLCKRQQYRPCYCLILQTTNMM